MTTPRGAWMVVSIAIAAAVDTGRAEPPPADTRRAEVVEAAMASQEALWREIGHGDPGPTLSCRALFTAALALCEGRRHPERLDRLFELAERMQDRDPASTGYGNFRWYWRDAHVTDPNAVEFCGFDMHLIRRLHRAFLPTPARDRLDAVIGRAIDGCLRHRVRSSYTNIAILNAANLITLGELRGRSDAAEEGYRRLDGLAADVWQFGLHEYCSPPYYAVDVRGLSILERFAKRDTGRRLARALLELVWTDIALNFLPAAQRLAGPHSRTYDYPRGLGGLQQDLRWAGWSDVPVGKGTEVLHVAQGTWSPPERLFELARTRFPRLVRQAWGPQAADSRTHWLLADVSLGCSGALYGPHDCPLTFDLPGRPGAVRGYFLPDGREDPYGGKKFATGSAGHQKALHLEPFWAGAQREADALGLVVYRDEDLAGPQMINLQSHFVVPRDLDGIWLRGRRVDLPRATEAAPARVSVALGDPLVLRKGSAAVGLRVVWARSRDGTPAEAALVDDGNRVGALRVTVEHRRDQSLAGAGAAFWVRVGGGLESDAAFTAWRAAFEQATPTTLEISPERIHLVVPGLAGAVLIAAKAPFSRTSTVSFDPAPSRAVLELDGHDIGRELLDRVEPCASFAAALAPQRVIDLPAHGAVRIEAEAGFVLPRMTVADDGQGTRFVWQPDVQPPAAASGSASWRLRVPVEGRYWLWGRVLAPDGTHDSFSVVVRDANGASIVEGPWHLPRSPAWQWTAATIGASRGPTPLDLPAGEVQLTVLPREVGTRLDALWLTTDPAARP
ncbi:MAG: hypothetical protein ACKOEM_01260 [Planctomycetia bacterium]